MLRACAVCMEARGSAQNESRLVDKLTASSAEAAHTCLCRAPVEADAAVAGGVIQQVMRHIPRPAQLLTAWPPMGAAMLHTGAARHIPVVVHWLAHSANVGGEQGDGGASPLLIPLLHHALRRCAYPLPNGAHLPRPVGRWPGHRGGQEGPGAIFSTHTNDWGK
jgi:hypothetical protein